MEDNKSNFIILVLSGALFLIGILEVFFGGMLNYFKYFAIFIPILYTFNMPISINRKNMSLIYGILFYLLFELLINLFHDDYISISIYIVLNALFIIYISKTSMILNDIEKITSYMYYITLIIACFVFLNFMREPVLMFNKNLIYNVIINDGRERYKFGFQHANYLGSICFIFLVNISFLFSSRIFNIKRKLILIASSIFILYIILLSGSRTASYAYVVFIFTFIFLKALYTPYKRFFLIIAATIIIVGAYRFINEIDFYNLLDNTNRFGPLVYNVNVFLNLDTVYKGIGFYNHMSIYKLRHLFINIDNYYIYVFITQGFIGLFVNLAIILTMFFSISKILDSNTKCFMYAFFVSFIVYSLFETYFFIPGAFLSYYFWTIGYSMINFDNKKAAHVNDVLI